VLAFFENTADVENSDKQKEAILFADEMFVNLAKDTDGAIAYYLRLDPTISNSTAGIFFSKMDGGDEFIRLEPTDISLYDKDDVEHVGWYWQPYEAGKPVWMTPYYNQNNNILMISYVIPLYLENVFIGVVGMDFDYTVLTDIVQKIKIYENGFAHLELNDIVIFDGTKNAVGANLLDHSEDYLRVSEDLANGMTFALYASYDDIFAIRKEIALNILLSTVLLTAVFILLVFFVVKKVAKPLRDLTEASGMLSKGNYDIKIEHSDTYEIQQLSCAFENMLVSLREHQKMQHLLAYRDPLTGLRNMTSYKSWTSDFDSKIKEESISFGVIVLDLNYLKETNDTYGHNVGNHLIVAASRVISDTFKRSPVFRIGGDEFVVILQNRDFKNCDELIRKLYEDCNEEILLAGEQRIPVSIAIGSAVYDPQMDNGFMDVFNRADDAMYKHKREIKGCIGGKA
jgi:diguanylate cyclase (GGDEF)-like protein